MIAKVRIHIGRLLPKNAFARGVSVLVGGTASAQLLLVLAAPLLTRLYTPEDFGLLAVYAGLLALIGVVSSLRYELAIPLSEDDQEAAKVAVLSLLLVVFSMLLTAILVLFFGASIAVALSVPQLADFLWLLPVGVLLGGAYTVFHYWAIRNKRFSTIAGTKLRQALATIAIQLVAFKVGGLALLFGQVAGQSVGTARLGRPALAMPAFKQVTWSGIVRTARRYRQFPMFTTWAGLLNTGGTQLPPLMFAALFGAGAVGFYALAHRVLTLPMSLVGEAVRNVFFSGAGAAHRNHLLGLQVGSLLENLMQVAIPPILILAIAGPELFSYVFGEQWRVAGEFAQWMTPWLFLQFCTGPLTIVFAAVEKQHVGLIMQGQLFSVRVIMILIGAATGDLLTTIILFSLGSAFSYSLFLLMILHAAEVPFGLLWRRLIRASLLSLLAISPMAFLFFPDKIAIALPTALGATMPLVFFRYLTLYRYRL